MASGNPCKNSRGGQAEGTEHGEKHGVDELLKKKFKSEESATAAIDYFEAEWGKQKDGWLHNKLR